jgi:hypothetical protein
MGSVGAEVLSAGDVEGRNLSLPRVGRLARASVLGAAVGAVAAGMPAGEITAAREGFGLSVALGSPESLETLQRCSAGSQVLRSLELRPPALPMQARPQSKS